MSRKRARDSDWVAFVPDEGPQAATHRHTAFNIHADVPQLSVSSNSVSTSLPSEPVLPSQPINWNTDAATAAPEHFGDDDIPLFGSFADMDPAYIEHLADIDLDLLEKRKRGASVSSPHI